MGHKTKIIIGMSEIWKIRAERTLKATFIFTFNFLFEHRYVTH